MNANVFCYVGIKSCGHMVAAAVDRPENAKDNAKEVAKWMRSGLTIERRPVEDVRTQLQFCKCEKAAKLPFAGP